MLTPIQIHAISGLRKALMIGRPVSGFLPMKIVYKSFCAVECSATTVDGCS